MKKINLKKFIRDFIANEIRSLNSLTRTRRSFEQAVDLCLRTTGRIVITGIGKSGVIGSKLAATFNSVGIPSAFLHSAEAMHGDFGILNRGDLLIAISASGETKEVNRVAAYASRNKIPIVVISGNSKSSLAKLSSAAVIFNVQHEGSPYNLAPMASATASLAAGDMLASAVAHRKGFSKKDFSVYHPGGAIGLGLTSVSELMTKKGLPLVFLTDSLIEAIKEINSKKKGVVGILDNRKRLVGVISDGDVRRFLASGRFSYKSALNTVIKKDPKTIVGDASLKEALEKMEFYKITSLFVVDKNGKLKGLVHMHQIVEHKIL